MATAGSDRAFGEDGACRAGSVHFPRHARRLLHVGAALTLDD